MVPFGASSRWESTASGEHDVVLGDKRPPADGDDEAGRRDDAQDAAALSSSIVPRDHDVLFGRGAVVHAHPGNDHLISLVRAAKPAFVSAAVGEKRNIALDIIKTIQSLDPPGRFLVQDPNATTDERVWIVAAEAVALEKIKRKLREKGRRGDSLCAGAASEFVDGTLHRKPEYRAPRQPMAARSAGATTTASSQTVPEPWPSRVGSHQPSSLAMQFPARATNDIPAWEGPCRTTNASPVDLCLDLRRVDEMGNCSMGDEGGINKCEANGKAPQHEHLDVETQPLGEWIASHRSQMKGKAEPAVLARWRNYLEQSVRLLLSLAKALAIEYSGSAEGIANPTTIRPNSIAVQNVRVRQWTPPSGAEELTANFVDCDGMLSSGDGATGTEYAAMAALGRISYELFMLGRGPNISSLEASMRSNSPPPHNVHANEEDEIMEMLSSIDMLSKSARTVRLEGNDDADVVGTMQEAGVPLPLCQFVADLLDEGDGPFSQSDDSFVSFAEVLADLKQMLDDPDAFLHASSPDRWRLKFGEKLYGRDGDLKAMMDGAHRVGNGKRSEVILVGGHSGAGKSRLVRRGGMLLERKGWRFLHTKFDRLAHPEPLSILAFAFDSFLVPLTSCPQHSSEGKDDLSLDIDLKCCCAGSQTIRYRLLRSISPQGLALLSKHVPTLGEFLDTILPEVTAMNTNEKIMHTLFGQLLRAISSEEAPVLFFVDDLQWADPLSLALFTALVEGDDADPLQLSSVAHEMNVRENTSVMFVGSFRDNEVDENHRFAKVVRKFQANDATNITNISLSGFTLATLNEMLSESLCMPVRKVRSLSEVVMQKTDGQPLYIIEFVQKLTADKLLTNSFARGWEWDTDSIEFCPITESAAELFAIKLKRMPRNVLRGLQIISCFGSQVDRHMLGFVVDYDGESSVDISAAIDVALSEGLLDQAASMIQFTHDMIQTAAINSIAADDLIALLHKLVAALLKNASAVGELDSIVYVVVDLANRIGSDATSSSVQRAQFAELNLRAGSKAIAVPDFASAAKYAENGISFLDNKPWENQYELSLGLHDTAVASHFSTFNQVLLMKRMNAIFQHGKSFSDKFKAHCVQIKLHSLSDLPMAIKECLNALEQLGEPLYREDISYDEVHDEVMKCREELAGEKKKEFLSTRRMTDSNQERAMKMMSSLLILCHQEKSFLAAFVACQMVKISLKVGHCEESVVGAASFASTLVIYAEDIEEANDWAHMALSLMKLYDRDKLLPIVAGSLYGNALSWKQSFQSTLDSLAEAVRASFHQGDAGNAIKNTIFYVMRSLNCGKDVSVLKGEVEALACQHGNHFRKAFGPLLQFWLTPMYNNLRDLEGTKDQCQKPNESSFPLEKVQFKTNDAIMKVVVEKKNLMCLHIILSLQTAKSFVFRDMDKALEYTNMFYEQFLTTGLGKRNTSASIFNIFYEGLIAFYFARRSGKEEHSIRGENALMKMMEWSEHSEWNFQSKVCLMEAELQCTQGEFEKAAASYETSIRAAREHRFVHEEAMACELAALFFFERGFHPKSCKLYLRSLECYAKWGAHAVAGRVRESIQGKFDPDLIEICRADIPASVVRIDESHTKKRQLRD